MNDFTVDNIIDVLAGYIEPIAGKCLQAQANRVPMPKDQFCILRKNHGKKRLLPHHGIYGSSPG